ncbi:uncharacterized protein [Aegilops tauschii subsp. strangulata]|uniref:HMA domain-containing protein n=1 Tax=Triticum aestivum TaxID=4565 RepID=A0A3B6QP71_WHEAT|nr:uncharacterized protein LOC109762404 [Aegilops tauschii subsp. strangulata]
MIMAKEQHKSNVSKTCVLKVIMHCQCNGCIKKINDGVKEIALSEGVERADLVVETAEVIVVGRMDPEKLCCLLHELTQKHVKIETERTVSEGETAASWETKNRVGQVTSGLFASDLPEESPVTPTTPSAPPIPEAWRSLTVPSQRCAYRWSLPLPGALGVWAASDIEGTMAVYEL